MFRRTQKVLVAFSGGPDSLATLLLLRELGRDGGFSVTACHFDHQLRPESSADMERAREMCAGLDLECVTGEGDVRGVALQMKRGIEEMAREMRYQFLAFVAEKEGADCIATGHTADDQAETILMRIVRGSGIRGIRGMLPVSTVPGSNAQRLIRPLLETPRVTTQAICAEWGIAPLEDASNTDVSFRRNRVRHETMGSLAVINPSIADALIGLGRSAREAFEPIEKQSFEVQPLERGPIGAIFHSTALARLGGEALGLVIEREASFYHLRPETNRTRIENLLRVVATGHGSVAFGDVAVEASCGKVRLGPHLEAAVPIPATILNVPGDTRAGPWVARIRTEPLEGDASSPVVAFDSETILGVLKLRSLDLGDRIRFRGVNRKVSDLLVNEKVPSWERSGMVVVSDGEGVLALIGATTTFVRDTPTPDLWLKLASIPQR